LTTVFIKCDKIAVTLYYNSGISPCYEGEFLLCRTFVNKKD